MIGDIYVDVKRHLYTVIKWIHRGKRKMTQTKFLITGATGATGGHAARQLLGKGQAVRVLAHRPDDRSEQLQKIGAEVVFGDFLDFDSVRAALNGVRRAYFCYPINPGLVQATAQFAQAAKEAGVEAIVNMSMISARSDATSNAARQQWLSERVFDWSGVPAVHLRPTLFAQWLLLPRADDPRGSNARAV